MERRLDPEWVVEARRRIGYPLVYSVLKGSRLFGISEPMSDVDLVVVYQVPTAALLGLTKPRHTIATSYIQDTADGELLIDLKAYELERFMHHMLGHNGNFVEALCAPVGCYDIGPLRTPDVGRILREVGASYKTKELHAFYRGYAFGQLRRAAKQINTAKGLTYVYREAFCGIVLLKTGNLIYDFKELCATAQELLSWESGVLPQLTNTRAVVSQSLIDRAVAEFRVLERYMDLCLALSPLPETYDGSKVLSELLVAARYARM